MRPGQNKRMRGRNNNNNSGRKGPNPLTRSYESNGPDVKIRGTAHHIGEKYLQLARDAQSSGDPVMAESYLQHAEHYFRLIAAAQQAQQQAAYGYQRPPGEPQEQDEDGDDDFESLPDRFASPSERAPQQPAPQPYAERPPYNGGDRQPYDNRQNYQNQPQPHFDRPPQPQADRQSQPDRQPQPDRQNYDRGQDRPYDNRNGRGDRGGYQDRNGQSYQDRPYAQGAQPERNGQDRQARDQDRPQRDQERQPRDQDRQQRDFDNRGYRNNRGPRDYRDNSQPREQRQPVVDEPASALPAFITGPTRLTAESTSSEPPVERETPISEAPATDGAEEANLHLRPRRRRRPKSEFVGGEGEARQEAAAGDPVGE